MTDCGLAAALRVDREVLAEADVGLAGTRSEFEHVLASVGLDPERLEVGYEG